MINKTIEATDNLDISPELEQKYTDLKQYIRSLGSLLVAFSGGVDSTFLARVAKDTLGDNMMCATARSCSFPARELREAREFCEANGITHVTVESEELDVEGFADNPPNRCYLCKRELFQKLAVVAREHGMAHIAEGSNTDDDGDYRPGLVAVREAGAVSPLRLAKLSKNDIRALSRRLGLPTWRKQSFACLSSRFPYGEKITREGLAQIDKAEQFLLDEGFEQVRVRKHGNLARIETTPSGIARMMDETLRERVHKAVKDAGFTYVALDLLGYRTGSMNETLTKETIAANTRWL